MTIITEFVDGQFDDVEGKLFSGLQFYWFPKGGWHIESLCKTQNNLFKTN